MTAPDMAKAMEYAHEFADSEHCWDRTKVIVELRVNGMGNLADALEEAVVVSRAFIAQGAELAHLRQTVESVAINLRGFAALGDDPQLAACLNSEARRLTGAKGE